MQLHEPFVVAASCDFVKTAAFCNLPGYLVQLTWMPSDSYSSFILGTQVSYLPARHKMYV